MSDKNTLPEERANRKKEDTVTVTVKKRSVAIFAIVFAIVYMFDSVVANMLQRGNSRISAEMMFVDAALEFGGTVSACGEDCRRLGNLPASLCYLIVPEVLQAESISPLYIEVNGMNLNETKPQQNEDVCRESNDNVIVIKT